MKIDKIEWNDPVATVYWSPNWLEQLFKVKPIIKKYIDSGYKYVFGGEWKWFKENGELYGKFPELDAFVRNKEYKQKYGDKLK